ncbi:hypothetical protein ACEWY4_018323 [Coilia grayii]|uniref:Gypsy retrotransposon integrase-like protein 1 n=1 Tax=Coilia grayii TaxID=363190 RepID=A0ABD1JKF6_9TELE
MNVIADCWTQVFQGTHPGEAAFRSTTSPRAGAAWTKAFAACRRALTTTLGPLLQGVAKLEPQPPVVLPPEMEVMLWTQVPQGKDLADCLVTVEDLDNGDNEWRVARTLSWLHQGKLAIRLCNPNPFPVQLPQGRPLATVVQVATDEVRGQSELVLTSPEPAVVEVAVQRIQVEEAVHHPVLALQGQGLTADQQDRLTAMLRRPEKAEVRTVRAASRPVSQGVATEPSESRPEGVGPELLSFDRWRKAQQADPSLRQLYAWKEQRAGPTKEVCSTLPRPMQKLLAEWAEVEIQHGVLVRRVKEPDSGMEACQVLVPTTEAKEVWWQYHQASGHASSERTLGLLRRRFFWAGMATDCSAWAQDCVACALSKARPEARAPLQSIRTTYPFEVVGLDYLSLGRPADTYPYILVITALFSRYAVAVPTRDQTAQTTVKALWGSFIQTFGCPERILSDRGGAFESELMQQLCALYGCVKSRTTPYHPQGNGAAL